MRPNLPSTSTRAQRFKDGIEGEGLGARLSSTCGPTRGGRRQGRDQKGSGSSALGPRGHWAAVASQKRHRPRHRGAAGGWGGRSDL